MGQVIQIYDLAIYALKLQENQQPLGDDYLWHDDFTNMICFQKRKFQELLDQHTALCAQDEESDFKRIPQGHLVQFACGHRGQPSRIEEKRISRLMRKSGFIPMLEDIAAKAGASSPMLQPQRRSASSPPKKPEAPQKINVVKPSSPCLLQSPKTPSGLEEIIEEMDGVSDNGGKKLGFTDIISPDQVDERFDHGSDDL